MKTRRKSAKTPSKGRRSSVICVKKSPINRKTTRRVLRSQSKCTPSFHYESPLRFMRQNGPESSASSSTKTTTGVVRIDESVQLEDEIEENMTDISNLSLKDEPVDQVDEKKSTNESEEDVDSKVANSSAESSTTLKRKVKVDMLTALQNRKKRKVLKKSPLSKLNESDDKLSESVIILDDSESLPDTKAVLTETTQNVSKIVNSFYQEVNQNIVKSEPLSNTEYEPNSDEVIVIDCDSSFMEMEAYHNAFNQSENCSLENPDENWTPENVNENLFPVNSNENRSPINESVIVIQDDDSPIQTRQSSPQPSEEYFAPMQARPTTPKTNDDCFVVWSSLPIPSTSNANPQESRNIRVPNYDSSLLKYDKIFLDTSPDRSNLKYLNNENDKPKKYVRSVRDTTKTKKSLIKSPKVARTVTKVTKAATKTTKAVTKSTKVATATSKTATATLRTASATLKAATAVTKTPVKKKTKNKGELIFLSESQEESAKKTKPKKGKLREIVIDGSNVAMAYTNNKTFSEKGIKMLIDYFTKRGHSVKVFVPQYRRSRNFPLLEKWYTDGVVVFTPSRKLGNKTFTPYDDRYILEYATARNGIVVSQDQFRDLYAEKPEYRDTIENRILVPTFVGDYVMFPEDPLGRDGPTLSEFLRH